MTLLLLACSGPGAARAIEQSIRLSNYCAIFAGFVVLALLVFCLRKPRRIWPVLVASRLLAIHPAWTTSAIHGDCDHFKLLASSLVTIVLFCLLLAQAHLVFGTRRL